MGYEADGMEERDESVVGSDEPSAALGELAAYSPAEQATLRLRQWIESGLLPAGKRLPSERDLADRLGVSRAAVRAGFVVLEQEGLVQSSPRRARRVRPRAGGSANAGLMTRTIAALVQPGAVDIALPFKGALTQQHCYEHGGVITSIADAAAGYSALTLAAPGLGVLTTELKVNFLRSAGTERIVARARVLKPGRSLTVRQTDVSETSERGEEHVLTGLVTMMFMEGLSD